MSDLTGLNSVLILPTYNEIENLEPFIRAVRISCPSIQILIVDDDSPDRTGEVADRLSVELEAVEVIHRVGQRGLGSAYRAGFAQLDSKSIETVITMDADFSHDPAAIPLLIQQFDLAPMSQLDHAMYRMATFVAGRFTENFCHAGETNTPVGCCNSMYEIARLDIAPIRQEHWRPLIHLLNTAKDMYRSRLSCDARNNIT